MKPHVLIKEEGESKATKISMSKPPSPYFYTIMYGCCFFKRNPTASTAILASVEAHGFGNSAGYV